MKRTSPFVPRISSMLVWPFLISAFVLAFTAAPSGVSEPTYTTIDVPGATLTSASRINNRGQIVGGYVDADGNGHGFLLDKGVFTTIDVPGATGTGVFGINNSGAIAGVYLAGGTEHGFLLDHGVFTTIDPPGSTLTDAFDINNRGQIVGHYVDANGTTHGFLFDDGVFTTIDPPGSVFTQAIGINACWRHMSAPSKPRLIMATFWRKAPSSRSIFLVP